MKYEMVKELDEEGFRRLTGIKRATFKKMVEILHVANKEKKAKGGRKNKLSEENMLLIVLEYLREYRTYFHISQSYGVTAYKTVKWVEDPLPRFCITRAERTTKKRREVLVIDATETPIERPKKSRKDFIQERRKNIR